MNTGLRKSCFNKFILNDIYWVGSGSLLLGDLKWSEYVLLTALKNGSFDIRYILDCVKYPIAIGC